MLFVQEKIKKNKRIVIWVLLGLIGTILVLTYMWINLMILFMDRLTMLLVPPVVFTIFCSYLIGVLIRGLEISSFGLDLSKMDHAEIEIMIGLLEKEKQEKSRNTRDNIIQVERAKK